MIYLYWSLPFIVVIVLLVSGRVSSGSAGLVAAAAAAVVSLTAAPVPASGMAVLAASAKGVWLAALVGAVILGGLFFREIVSGDGPVAGAQPLHEATRRRRAFVACFLVGPFAESATGFGVGQVAAIAMLRGLGLPAVNVVLLGLFSQILVPWGAMANGTMVGAAFADLPARVLGTYSALLSFPLLAAWLVQYWRMAAQAGLKGSRSDHLIEAAWVVAVCALLVLANHLIGPEVAPMAVLGPAIVLRFWREERPDRQRWRAALRVGLPYAVLIAGLAASRAIPALEQPLARLALVRPFEGGPAWSPLLHPGSWLVAVGIATALLTRRPRAVGPAAVQAWASGRKAVVTIGLFLVAATIMADAGIAAALAQGLRGLLGRFAVLATPLLAGTFGALTGSGNATNGLLMASQASLAADGRIPLAWIAALQNTAAAALTMLSPARVATGCALMGSRDLEREVYRQAWPLGAAALGVLLLCAAVLLVVV